MSAASARPDSSRSAVDPWERALAAVGANRPVTGDAGASSTSTAPVVVDVGGGSGTSAVPLAQRGCRVIVVDSSIDALAILRRRATDAGVGRLIDGVQGDADVLAGAVPAGSADLVLCHHLLEELDDPAAAIEAIAQVLRPGGVASLLTAGRYGAVLAQARAGRSAQARAILADPDGRFSARDPLRRRYDLAGLTAAVGAAGLTVESASSSGIGAPDAALDAILGADPVLREIGTDLHVLARRQGQSS